MGEINALKKNIKDFLEINNLNIPDYQRPYRWEDDNVIKLLEDIDTNFRGNKEKYLIGSVILHKNYNKNTLDIVDGQQRITTLLLIKKACGYDIKANPLKYRHSISFERIIKNYAVIEDWLKNNIKDGKCFWKYIDTHCQFVEITVDDLSEAFQMFDSQNGRGKELEPYNLLKAYHIRAMDEVFESKENKRNCDITWENATQYYTCNEVYSKNFDILKQVFSEQLYRTRIWSKRKSAWKFTKKEINEFKGITVYKNTKFEFPYQNFYILLSNMTSKNSSLRSRIEANEEFLSCNYITQPIINGKPFFDYVENYIEIYKKMFVEFNTPYLKEFKEFYYKYCLRYDVNCKINPSDNGWYLPNGYGPNRTGDCYLREVYKSLIFFLFDKFGESVLNEYYEKLYRLVYLERIASSSIKYSTCAEFPAINEYFSIIDEAKNLNDLRKLNYKLENRQKEVNGQIEAEGKDNNPGVKMFYYRDENDGKNKEKDAEIKSFILGEKKYD